MNEKRLPARWAWAEIDCAAITHNVRQLINAADGAEVWSVVKADGYGHGAVRVAQAAVEGGATGLCVALTSEGVALRQAGITEPILLLSEQPRADAADVVAHDLIPTVYGVAFVDALDGAVPARGAVAHPIHVNVDTGMQRVGIAAEDAVAAVRQIVERSDRVRLAGLYTHLANADEPGHESNEYQLSRFDSLLNQLDEADLTPDTIHLANSAAALRFRHDRCTLVRVGIATYGISPGLEVDHLMSGFRPALSLKARVSHVKRVRAGSSISYGWHHQFAQPTTVATVPLGYADGVPRGLGTVDGRRAMDVLIGGQRCPIVGVVTMDQLMVDVSDAPVAIGDEVVLLGTQRDETITASDWATHLDTIAYEIVCGISARIPRVATHRSA